MRYSLFFYLIVFFFSWSATGQRLGPSSEEEAQIDQTKAIYDDNESLIRRYFEKVWKEADLQVVNEVTPQPFILHYQGQPIVATHKEHQEVVRYWLNGFPDYQVNVQDVISQGDKVVARYTFTGTHKGKVLGISPTGNKIEVSGIWICRIENVLLAECWEEYDEQGLREQLLNAR